MPKIETPREGVQPDVILQSATIPQVDEPTPDERYIHYAWGRMPRRLIQNITKEVLSETPLDESFIDLDACSATPWFREMKAGQFGKNFCLRPARIALNTFQASMRRKEANIIPGIRHVRQEKLTQLNDAIFSKGSPIRSMLEAALYETAFDPPEGLDLQKIDALSAYLLTLFQAKPARYLIAKEENTTDEEEKGTWINIDIQETYASESESSIEDSICDLFRKEVKNIPGSSLSVEKVPVFMKAMADHFAKTLVKHHIRRAHFLSLDLAGVDEFERIAPDVFPEKILKSVFFKHVLDPSRHIVGDIKNLHEFSDNTVSVYSMIEGFPFYKEYFSYADGIQVIDEARRILRVGGKFIVFPWLTDQGKEMSDLMRFVQYMRLHGFRVELEEHKKEDLVEGMGKRERRLTEISKIFAQDGDSLTLLVATKVS